MTRTYHINGETMVAVKGRANGPIPAYTFLGLAKDQITITLGTKSMEDMEVDAWRGAPPEIQVFLNEAMISMDLIHYDLSVLRACIAEANAGVAADGFVSRAGALMGNYGARFAANNYFLGLNLLSPIETIPWRFWYTYLVDSITYPLGTQKSIARLRWRAVPYTNDPWGGGSAQPSTVAGTGAVGAILYDHTLDS